MALKYKVAFTCLSSLHIQILVDAEPFQRSDINSLITKVFDQVNKYSISTSLYIHSVSIFNNYNPNSEVSKLNDASGHNYIKTSPKVLVSLYIPLLFFSSYLNCFNLPIPVFAPPSTHFPLICIKHNSSRFDPTVGRLVQLWKNSLSHGTVPDDSTLSKYTELVYFFLSVSSN